ADLRDFPLLMLDSDDGDVTAVMALMKREMKKRDFPESSINPRTFPSFESLLGHVRAGQGWTLLPSVLTQRIAGLACVTLSDVRVPFRTTRIWRRADTRPLIHTVLEQM